MMRRERKRSVTKLRSHVKITSAYILVLVSMMVCLLLCPDVADEEYGDEDSTATAADQPLASAGTAGKSV